jgi:hypothetical protein
MIVKIVLNGQEKNLNLSTMSRAELLDLKMKLDTELDDIKDQIKRAEAHTAQTGEYAEPAWYWSAVRARKHKGRQSQAVQMELSKRRKERKKVDPLANYFMNAARHTLDPNTFNEILSLARNAAQR